MFSDNGVKTNLYKDHDATLSNLRTLLLTTKGELLGDPDFGCSLKRMLFEQGTPIIKDLIIDDIYTAVLTFMPQVILKRNDINVYTDGVDVFVDFKCVNLINQQIDTFTINLTTDYNK
jgi:phage baseplate assembly protein W